MVPKTGLIGQTCGQVQATQVAPMVFICTSLVPEKHVTEKAQEANHHHDSNNGDQAILLPFICLVNLLC